MMQQEEPPADEQARSCLCGKTDQRVLVFVVQTGFGVLSSAFYMYQLSRGADQGVYLALLTGTIASFMPNPTFSKK